MSALELVKDAKKLIASPKSWCQGHAKITSQDGTVLRRDLLTALLDAGKNYGANDNTLALDTVYEETGRFGITAYNDSPHTTHAHIYALLERAERKLS